MIRDESAEFKELISTIVEFINRYEEKPDFIYVGNEEYMMLLRGFNNHYSSSIEVEGVSQKISEVPLIEVMKGNHLAVGYGIKNTKEN